MQKHLKQKLRTKAKSVLQEQELSDRKSGPLSSVSETETFGSSQSDEHTKTKNESTKASNPALTAEEFDRRFDEGESIFELGVDRATIRRPGLESKRFNIDVPAHIIDKLDAAAQIRGVTRQALVKTWLYDRLLQEKA